MKRFFSFIPLSLLLWLAALPAAQALEHVINTDKDSGIDIKVMQAFSDSPRKGYLPLRVSINNRSGSQGTWTITNKPTNIYEGSSLWSERLTVPAGQKREFDLLYPVLSVGYESISVKGPQTNGSLYMPRTGRYGYGYSSDEFCGVASDGILSSVNNSRLDAYFKDLAVNTNTGAKDIYFFPTDWRGYTGIDILWFQQLDWVKAEPEVRRAILQWVAQGGDLRIRKDDGTPEDASIAGLPGAGNGRIPYGMGAIRVYPYLTEKELLLYPSDLSTVPEEERYTEKVKDIYAALGANFWLPAKEDGSLLAAAQKIPRNSIRNTAAASLSTYYDSQSRSVAFGMIFISVLAFVIIVGPVNFWLFARGRKRYRLFFTTPIISVTFCLLISASILLSDGVGGSGLYTRLFLHTGDNGQELLVEEQFARTGLLVNRDFTLDTNTWAIPLGNYVTGSWSNATTRGIYQQSGDAYSGNWFGSRRTQGLALTTQRPTRAGFEIREKDGKRTVLSSFPATCPVLYLTDGNAQAVYRAKDVVTGTPAELEPVTEEEFNRWLALATAHLGEETRKRISRLDLQPNHIYASVENYSGQAPQTLQSIDWQPYQSLVIAPVRGIGATTEENAQ